MTYKICANSSVTIQVNKVIIEKLDASIPKINIATHV